MKQNHRDPVLLVLSLVSILVCGCAGVHKETVYKDKDLTVVLRSRRGETRDFDHPAIIAPVRLSHILARVDIRLSVKEGQRRIPAIPLESLDSITDGLSLGLQKADPSQEVVVLSMRTHKRFGIFNHEYLTSFIAYVKEGNLFLHLSRSEWEVPAQREKRLPQPEIGVFPTKFRIVSGKSMEQVDQQALAIDWRAPLFDRPTRTRVTPGGKVVRRVILMEDDGEEDDSPSEDEAAGKRPELAPIPAGISPATLRALADLEDQRRQGVISEAIYARRRLAVLEAEAAQ